MSQPQCTALSMAIEGWYKGGALPARAYPSSDLYVADNILTVKSVHSGTYLSLDSKLSVVPETEESSSLTLQFVTFVYNKKV